MPMFKADQDLIDHVCRQSALTDMEARRLVSEIVAFYNETPNGFIRRRHIELQKSGLPNSTIYTKINDELQHHRFTSEPMSIRQIRRAIYG